MRIRSIGLSGFPVRTLKKDSVTFIIKAPPSAILDLLILMGNLFPALRGVGPEFEAGSGAFRAQMLPDHALRVKFGSWVQWSQRTRAGVSDNHENR
jgi:hypothetical protein